jgi:type IV pilus assembly protein PilX
MRHRPTGRGTSQGYVLIVGLLFLLVLSLLAVSMMKSFGMQEKIASNTREKQRAFEAAQSALRYGEWWLARATVRAEPLQQRCQCHGQ